METKLTKVKKDIINTARTLFYEQGFEDTTYKQIAGILNISPGSLSYHFDNKSDIGNIVYIEYMQKYYNNNIMHYLLEKFDSYSPKLASAIEMRLQLMVFREDKNVFRFYKELFHSQQLSGANTTMTRFTLMNNKYKSGNEYNMRVVAAKGASVALITSYFDGQIDIPFEDFADYKTKTVLTTIGIEPDMVDSIVAESKALISEMNIEILPCFEVSIS